MPPVQCKHNRLFIAEPEDPAQAAKDTQQSLVSSNTADDGAPNATTADSNATTATSLEMLKEALTGVRSNDSDAYEGFPWRADVDFKDDEVTTKTIVEDPISIAESGLYSMWFVSCDPRLPEVSAHHAHRCMVRKPHACSSMNCLQMVKLFAATACQRVSTCNIPGEELGSVSANCLRTTENRPHTCR